MNALVWMKRRIFDCPKDIHTVFLERDEFQVLSQVNLLKLCNVCKKQIPLRKDELDISWEIVDDEDD